VNRLRAEVWLLWTILVAPLCPAQTDTGTNLELLRGEAYQVCAEPARQSEYWNAFHTNGYVRLDSHAHGEPRTFVFSEPEWTNIQSAISASSHPDSSASALRECVSTVFGSFARKLTPTELAGPAHTPAYAVVRVFYATDRSFSPGAAIAAMYGSDRGELAFGQCDVSIPRDHRMGALEAPSILRLEFREDPRKHVVLLAVSPTPDENAYYDQIKSRVTQSSGKSAFVFVHGYNVSFEDAARRAAQITYDLGFDGAPIFFSWPAKGDAAAYTRDETNVDWATPHLQQFLHEILDRGQVKNLYLIAHSMGNRALVTAVRNLAVSDLKVRSSIREIVLAAPDIDADIFKNEIVPALVGTGNATSHVTLYASSKDLAIEASKRVHGYARAGDSSNIVLARGLESIDASAVDTSLVGHSYYADNRSVLSDIFYLISGHVRACSRFGLHQHSSAVGTYCILQP
jgi:esterase/lipase superfamily enzyme